MLHQQIALLYISRSMSWSEAIIKVVNVVESVHPIVSVIASIAAIAALAAPAVGLAPRVGPIRAVVLGLGSRFISTPKRLSQITHEVRYLRAILNSSEEDQYAVVTGPKGVGECTHLPSKIINHSLNHSKITL